MISPLSFSQVLACHTLKAAFVIVGLQFLGAPVAKAGLNITVTSGAPTEDVRVQHPNQDNGGTTSLRYFPPRSGEPDKDGLDEYLYDSPTSKPRVWYYTRDRDLGQTFTTGATGFVLDALTLRTGASDSAVMPGALGAPVFLQIFKVTGPVTINNNGTTSTADGDGKYTRWRTFNTADPQTDDIITSESYESILVVTGIMPASFAKNTYLRWELTGADRIQLEPNTRYAWMIGFVSPAPNRSFSLANNFYGNYSGGHGIRRDGSDSGLEATFVRDLNDEADKAASRASAAFPSDLAARVAIQPGTIGFPDVCTYRDVRFYIQGSAPPPPPPPQGTIRTSDGTGADSYISSNSVTDPGTDSRMRIRNDATAIRKAYLRFDLSSLPASASEILNAELRLRSFAAGSGFPNPLTINIHGLNDGHPGEGWGEDTLNYSNAPAHNSSNAVDPTTAPLLGSFQITGGSVTAGQLFTLTASGLAGLKPFLQADTDRRITFILQSPNALSNSLDLSTKENATHGAPELFITWLSAGSAQTVSLPAAANLVGTVNESGALPGGISVNWTKASGPGSVQFAAPNALITTAAFSLPGTYVLRLNGQQETLTAFSEVAVVVHDSFSAWVIRKFPPETPVEDLAPDADPDGDGLDNFKEYALDSEPTTPTKEDAPSVGTEGPQLTLTYRRNLDAAGVTYRVLETTDLESIPWTPAEGSEEILSTEGNVQTVRFSTPIGSDPAKFLKLEVSGS